MDTGFESFVGLPAPDSLPAVLTGQYFESIDNFERTFAIRPDDTMVFLADRKLDPNVVQAICGLARSRGVKPPVPMDLVTFDSTVTADNTTLVEEGFLRALKAPRVIEMAPRFGDPVDLLENWPE